MAFEMNTTQKVVCALIAEAVFGCSGDYSGVIDWEEVRSEMSSQTVHGLVMDILPTLPMPEKIRQSWMKECLQVIRNGIRLRHEQALFLKLLEDEDIPYLILKGTAAAKYYPNPLLRGMGDVDVYVPPSFHKKVRVILRKNQYVPKQGENRSKRHIEYFKNDIEYELHWSFATINSEEERAYIDGLLEACCCDSQKKDRIVQGQYSFSAPETYVNGIVLLEHIGQHMRMGLGLRQVIDWMMFVNSNLHDEDWETFRYMARKAGLEKLAKAVTKMCVLWFGLKGSFDWCMDADNETAGEILAYLFDTGNFGRKNPGVGRVAAVENRFKNNSIITALQSSGESNWKLYKRHKWLRPFAWVYQIFRYTRQVLTSPDGIKTLRKGTDEANRRYNLMKSLGIYRK